MCRNMVYFFRLRFVFPNFNLEHLILYVNVGAIGVDKNLHLVSDIKVTVARSFNNLVSQWYNDKVFDNLQ